MDVGTIALLCVLIATMLDLLLLFVSKYPVTAERNCAERFSNGDDNTVTLHITNHRSYTIQADVIDEIPYQFQSVSGAHFFSLEGNVTVHYSYQLKPSERGEYYFGIINLLLYGPLGLAIRQVKTGEEKNSSSLSFFYANAALPTPICYQPVGRKRFAVIA